MKTPDWPKNTMPEDPEIFNVIIEARNFVQNMDSPTHFQHVFTDDIIANIVSKCGCEVNEADK